MTLEPGRRLGPYEIVAPIGSGGMGEVYEATDTRLGRTVAIKVLPESLAEHPERRARFEREARTVSQLSHPYVCTLHDVGEEERIHFLVMEHLDGETLAARLGRGALPLEKMMRFGAQIAEALDAAHRQGVVHRDLKPANVMLTSSGVKLLDFGLARLAAGRGEEVADLPTVTLGHEGVLTDEGTVLGTYLYMSPEQVEGAEADARSDIFALGAVLYEMVTGRRAFDGESAARVMAAVLKEEPEPLTEVQPVSPPAVDHVVSRCLAKDPEERWQSARDVAAELRWIREAGSRAGVADPVAKGRKGRERMAWGVAAVLGLATIVAVSLLVSSGLQERNRASFQFTVPAPDGLGYDTFPAVSPDGRLLAFVAGEEGEPHDLWVRPLGSLQARRLPRTGGAEQPFWSPDGSSIGFFADGELKRVDLDSGSVRTLAPATLPVGGSWSREGFILFARPEVGLFRVAESGGLPARLDLFEDDVDRLFFWPQMLPDGMRFLFFTWSGQATETADVYVGSLDGERPRLLTREVAWSRMLVDRDGYLLFAPFQGQGQAVVPLLARRFDIEDEELVGDAFQVAQQVLVAGPGEARFALGPDGLLVPRAASSLIPRELVWMNSEGERQGTVGPRGLWAEVDLSPDGSTIAATRHTAAETALWVLDAERGNPTRLSAASTAIAWSPDGARIAFSKAEGTPPNPFVVDVVEGGEPRRVTTTPRAAYPTGWTPDGEQLLLTVVVGGPAGHDIYLVPAAGGEAELLLGGDGSQWGGRVSPDGRWLGYVSDENGTAEVYVTRFSDTGRRWRVSAGGGTRPRWEPNGSGLLYSNEGRILRAPVESGDGFRAAAPEVVLEREGLVDWSPAANERFLVSLRLDEPVLSPPLIVISDWRAAAGIDPGR